jgi:hypothetical protein
VQTDRPMEAMCPAWWVGTRLEVDCVFLFHPALCVELSTAARVFGASCLHMGRSGGMMGGGGGGVMFGTGCGWRGWEGEWG